MKHGVLVQIAFACAAVVIVGAGPSYAETGKPIEIHKATGSFDVKLTPAGSADAPISSMTFDKVFHGDLEATSAGRMLAVRNAANGSAAYVAMERVTGTLAGRQGAFAMQQNGSMTKDGQSLAVSVVPGSGVDGLTGLSGTMDIIVHGDRHDYIFHYTLPD
jgi:hypothetical protein